MYILHCNSLALSLYGQVNKLIYFVCAPALYWDVVRVRFAIAMSESKNEKIKNKNSIMQHGHVKHMYAYLYAVNRLLCFVHIISALCMYIASWLRIIAIFFEL